MDNISHLVRPGLIDWNPISRTHTLEQMLEEIGEPVCRWKRKEVVFAINTNISKATNTNMATMRQVGHVVLEKNPFEENLRLV